MFLDLSGDGFDEAVAVLSENYNVPAVVIVHSEKPFHWRHRAVGDTEMTFRSTQVDAVVEGIVGAGDEFVVQWHRAGRLTFEAQRTVIEVPQNVPYILPNGRSVMAARATDARASSIHIDKDFVRGVAEELSDGRFVEFTVAPPVSVKALRLWRRTVDLVGPVVLDASIPASVLLRREMARLVAVSLLSTFPYDFVERVSGGAGVEPVSVRAAYEFVHHNAHLPIGPNDIAQAVGLSVRSLQLALRRYREITPTALLNGVRLEHVHSQLHAADSEDESVAGIAREWGFVHLGRFASAYRARYGEFPNETLRQAPEKHPAAPTATPPALPSLY